ncbi:SRPBCC domain-containing protein [Halomonas sp. LR3S48]|uniref:SRPBCC family protein n=1 Tax=Halomonas sp. LR3S48 TaxID=2982694 RepID=UPI0021E4CE70|nr:SRPBCC domain-containing protein [Halomonas sp. LR3S48]UYG04544.1 SRPBCC domain-containing protein [Halomonas sp. LR3S48]
MATLHHQVWIDAPREEVYNALASAEGLGQWWAPHTASETDEGLVLAHSPGPAHGDVQMKVLERTPHRRIEWEIISKHPERSPASAWTGTHIIFEIRRKENPGHWLGMSNEGQSMTVLDFYQVGWDEDSEFLGFCNYAWGLTLDMLRQWCESQD